MFVGPQCSGKTTIARLYGNAFDWKFIEVNGITKELSKNIIKDLQTSPKGIILFLDEFSMFSLVSLQAFRDYITQGKLKVLGATLSPVFGLAKPFNEAYTLDALDDNSLRIILERAEKVVEIPPDVDKQALITLANHDGQALFSILQNYKLRG